MNNIKVNVDILLLSVSDEKQVNYRLSTKKHMSVLLMPTKEGKWALPGNVLDINDDLDEFPKKLLKNDLNIENVYVEQLYTFGNVNRNKNIREVSVSYIGLVDKNNLKETKGTWFNISYEEVNNKVTVKLESDKDVIIFTIKKVLRALTSDRYDFNILENDKLVLDHPKIILSGIERLKSKVLYTDIVFNMMPEKFALGDLQKVYEVILNKKLLDPAFRRIIQSKVEKLDEMKTGVGHRPSYLYRYINKI